MFQCFYDAFLHPRWVQDFWTNSCSFWRFSWRVIFDGSMGDILIHKSYPKKSITGNVLPSTTMLCFPVEQKPYGCFGPCDSGGEFIPDAFSKWIAQRNLSTYQRNISTYHVPKHINNWTTRLSPFLNQKSHFAIWDSSKSINHQLRTPIFQWLVLWNPLNFFENFVAQTSLQSFALVRLQRHGAYVCWSSPCFGRFTQVATSWWCLFPSSCLYLVSTRVKIKALKERMLKSFQGGWTNKILYLIRKCIRTTSN